MAVKHGSYRPAPLPYLAPAPLRPIEDVMAEIDAVAALREADPTLTLLAALNFVQGRS